MYKRIHLTLTLLWGHRVVGDKERNFVRTCSVCAGHQYSIIMYALSRHNNKDVTKFTQYDVDAS